MGGVMGTGEALAGVGGSSVARGVPGSGGASDAVNDGSSGASGKAASGCGCKLGGLPATPPKLWALALAGIAMVVAKRARRRASRRTTRASEAAKPVPGSGQPSHADAAEDNPAACHVAFRTSVLLHDLEEIRILEKNLADVFGSSRPDRASPEGNRPATSKGT